MRWPFDKRADFGLTAIVLGVGVTVLIGLPALLALQHFRWWWPTNWMAVPLAVCVVGVVMLFVPLRRSAVRRGHTPVESTAPGAVGQPDSIRQSAPPLPVPAPIASSAFPLTGSAGPKRAAGGVSRPGELAGLLGAIPEMAEPSFRERVYLSVPQDVMQQVDRSDRTRLDLMSLAKTFQTYEHLHPWQALLDQLQELLPNNPHVANLAARLRELGLAAENAAQ